MSDDPEVPTPGPPAPSEQPYNEPIWNDEEPAEDQMPYDPDAEV